VSGNKARGTSGTVGTIEGGFSNSLIEATVCSFLYKISWIGKLAKNKRFAALFYRASFSARDLTVPQVSSWQEQQLPQLPHVT
jgi:hypothetical protein